MRSARPRGLTLLACLLAAAVITPATIAIPGTAAPRPELRFIDGPASPEDLVTVPGTTTVLASGLAEDPTSDDSVGHLYAIDADTGSVTELWPDGADAPVWDRSRYATCPGPPNRTVASPHGINLEQQADGTTELYVVNHGGREAIEVFELNRKQHTGLTWIGCVPLPPGGFGNGVAPLPDSDGLLVTDFFDPSQSDPLSQAFGDVPTGSLLRWSPASGWSTIPGTAMFGPNGVEVTPDGRAAFVAEWGKRRIHRIPLRGEPRAGDRAIVDVPFLPDNLRWSRQGRLLATGQDFTLENVEACQSDDLANCPTGITVVDIHPRSLRTRTVLDLDPEGFRAPTVANPVGRDLWIGAVKGSRIVVLDAPGRG